MNDFIYTASTAKEAREMNETKRIFGHISEEQCIKNKSLIKEEFKNAKPSDPTKICSVDNLHPNWRNQELHPNMKID